MIRKSVFYPMSFVFLVVIFMGVVFPKKFYDIENAIANFAFKDFGFLFQFSTLIFSGICLFLVLSKYGNIKFGGPHEKPEISFWNWFAIALCTGIGTGILFWGIAEPITHYMNPEFGIQPGTEAAAMFAMSQSFIHWTFVPYCMYGIMGIGIAYAVYNVKLPYQISSVLYPLFGDRVKGSVGALVDNICVFGIVGGAAGALGTGVLQMGQGINLLTGVPNEKILWSILLVVTVGTYIISSYTGIHKGIRILSDFNTKLFLAILLFIFIFGPTAFILSLGTQSVGHFFNTFLERVTYLSPIEGSEWPRWWPIFYWAIWLAYAPMIGMFLAKLSKGRTIRQFITVNIVLPSLFGMTWFMVFGGSALNFQNSGMDLWKSIAESGVEISTFSYLENYPLPIITSAIFIFTIFISYVTMADSMTSTISSLTTRSGNHEAPGKVKIFWGVMMALITLVALVAPQGEISGIDAVKQIATVAGFPILFFMILAAFSIVKMIIQQEKYDIVTFSDQILDEQYDIVNHANEIHIPSTSEDLDTNIQMIENK